MKNESESGLLCDIAEAIRELAAANRAIADVLRRLGNADASTPMGAIEALGDVIERGLVNLTDAISD